MYQSVEPLPLLIAELHHIHLHGTLFRGHDASPSATPRPRPRGQGAGSCATFQPAVAGLRHQRSRSGPPFPSPNASRGTAPLQGSWRPLSGSRLGGHGAGGFHPAMTRHSRACMLSVRPGNSRRDATAADSSPCCSNAVRIVATSASETTSDADHGRRSDAKWGNDSLRFGARCTYRIVAVLTIWWRGSFQRVVTRRLASSAVR